MGSSSSLVGRESELEFLVSHMSNAISGSGELVMISGEAGAGKTTLCEAFERIAVNSGCLVLVGRCVPGSQMPYLPFMEALKDQPSSPLADPDAIGEGGRFLLSVLDYLEKLSGDQPLVLRLEDLHWADSASIGLLHFLARNVRGSRVLIVGTYRPEDLRPSVSGEAHLLKEHLHIMRREGLCRELELALLGPDEIMRIVPLQLGGPVDERLKDHVANESRGNPLFAVEMVRYLAFSEQAVVERGVWTLHLDKEARTPTTIREVVLARIDHLPSEGRRVLEAAAVIGGRFEPELISTVYRLDRMQLLEDLEVLEDDHRLVLAEEGRYRFTHEKVRHVVYEGISRPRRRELHRLIGLQLEKRLPNDELLGPLSQHFIEAGERAKGVTYTMAAGRLCLRRKAVREAKAFLLTVLDQAAGDREFLDQQLEALEALGDLKNDASGPREWYSYYERFLELSGDRTARARVLAKAAECWDQLGLGDPVKAGELLDLAEAIADGDPRALAEIAYRRADLSGNEGRNDEALAQIRLAREAFGSLGDPIGTSKCIELQIAILRQALRFTEARELAEAQLRAVRALEDPEPLLRVGMLDAFISIIMGDTAAAKRYATEAIDLAAKLGMMWTYRLALYCRANARELEGDVEGAIGDVSKAWRNAREYESPFHDAMIEIDLGFYEAEAGLLESAEEHYEGALKTMEAFDPYPRSLLDMDLSILWAELLWRSGRGKESEETYRRTMVLVQGSKDNYELLKCSSRFAMSLARRGLEGEARQLFARAMVLAGELGCERRVQALADRVGLSI